MTPALSTGGGGGIRKREGGRGGRKRIEKKGIVQKEDTKYEVDCAAKDEGYMCIYISAAYREATMQRTLKVDENTVLAAPRLLLADHDGGQH